MTDLMIDQNSFFEKYDIKSDKFADSKLSWDELTKIYNHHSSQIDTLFSATDFLVKSLQRIAAINSIKVRIKNPEHLIEKIIRKTIKDPQRVITIENYQEQITDLIGIRVLHIFKQDWEVIHRHIMEDHELKETPKSYVREGDSQEIRQMFLEKNCLVEDHQRGYRSVHYLVLTKPQKTQYTVELQVRTIFEVLNRISGTSDEISSFTYSLSKHLEDLEFQIQEANLVRSQAEQEISKKRLEIEELVRSSSMKDDEKTKLTRKILELESSQFRFPTELRNQPTLARAIYGGLLGIAANQDKLLMESVFHNLGSPDAVKLALTGLTEGVKSAVEVDQTTNINSAKTPAVQKSIGSGLQKCPHCKQYIDNSYAKTCQHCGKFLHKI
jgi:putative GTP pyrophosphokinase